MKKKIFFSDRLYKQVINIIYKNGQFFCTIKYVITSKKKIIFSAVVSFGALFSIPRESQSIVVPPRLSSAPKIHRSAPQHFHQYAPIVSPKLDRITFIKYREVPVCI